MLYEQNSNNICIQKLPVNRRINSRPCEKGMVKSQSKFLLNNHLLGIKHLNRQLDED